jgi:MtN3 and saliva related transmembrane protein
MEHQTIIGLFASVLTSTSLLPQLVKTIKEKKSEGVSMVMLVVLFAGLVCWVYYGILKSDLIIVISNSIALVINLAIGVLTLFYKRRGNTNGLPMELQK